MTHAKKISLFLVNLLLCILGVGFFVWLAVGLENRDSGAHRLFGVLLRNPWKVIGAVTAAGVLLCLPVFLKKKG